MLLRGRIFSLAFLSFLIFAGIHESKAQCPTFFGATYIPSINQICATDVLQPNYDITYGVTFSSNVPAGYLVRVSYEWGDGTRTFHNFAAADGLTKTFIAPVENHIYPLASGPCEYEVRFLIQISDGSPFSSCPGTLITDQLSSWERDDSNGGVIQVISPISGTNDEPVCEGVDVNVVFDNTSTFNCQDLGGGVPKIPNEETRWEQFVYNTGAIPAKIPNAFLNGVTQLTGAGGVDVNTNVQDPRGVAMIPASATNASPKRTTLPITAIGGYGPAFPVENDQIEVTLRMWNYCNPYDDPNIPGPPADLINGDNAPLESTATITIIGAPDPPTYSPTAPFCENRPNNAYNLTASGSGAVGATFQWYDDVGLTNLVKQGTVFNPVTEDGVDKTPAAPITRTYYLTETQASTCVSPPTTVTFSIHTNMSGGVISHPLGASPQHICTGDNPASFINSASATGGDGVNYNYQWQSSTTSAIAGFSDIGGATSSTYNPPVTSQTTWFRRRVRSNDYNITGSCDEAFSNVYQLIVDTPVIGGSIGNAQTICVGDDPGAISSTASPSGGDGTYTYQWESSTTSAAGPWSTIGGANSITYNPPVLAVTTWFRRNSISGVCVPNFDYSSNVIEITVDQLVVPGIIGNPQTICSGEDPGVITQVTPPSGGDGSSYAILWEESNTGGGIGFSAASGTNTNNTYDPPVSTSTTYYRRRITSGVCSIEYSNEIEITVNPLPTATVTGGGSVCSGNPAPDMVWTLTGTAPFDFTITRPAGEGGPLVVNNHPTSTYTYSGALSGGNYTMTVLQDNNTCNGTSLGGSATVTIGGISPTLTNFIVDPEICEQQVGTSIPFWHVDTDVAGDYNISYTIDGTPQPVESFPGIGAGGTIDFQVSYAQLGSTPGTYTIALTSAINTATGCVATLPGNTVDIIINPDPADPTNPIDNIACSSDITGAILQVDDPGAGFTVEWYSNIGLTIPAVGTPGGNNEEEFTPTSTASATYYAQVVDDATSCPSVNFATLNHSEDLLPANASIVTADFNTCNTSESIVANAVNNGGFGEWVFTSGLVWREGFDDLPTGTNNDGGTTAWSLDLVDVNPANINNPFEVAADVPTGRRFMVNNPSSNGVRWVSEPIATPASGNITLSVNVAFSGIGAAGDWIEGYYNTDGSGTFPIGAPNWFGRDDGSGNIQPFYTLTIPASGTVQLMIRIRNGGPTEFIYIDNVEVREDLGSPIPTIAPDRYNTNITVSGLLETELVAGTNEFTWNAYSALGVCQPAPASMTITRWSLPVVIDPNPDVCEDVYTSNQATIPLFSVYDDAVTGIPGSTDRTVVYYDDAARTNVVTTAIVNTLSPTIYTRVQRDDVTPNCTVDGTLTFNILTLPEVIDQNVGNNAAETEFCEDFPVGSGTKTGINLTDLNNDIVNNQASRSVAWFTDAGYSVPVPDPTSVSAVNNTVFYARVTETTSGSSCFNDAIATITVNTRPADNPIIGANTQCVGGATSLYQVTPGPAGTTYNWNVPGDFTVFGGGTINDFFVLLQFAVGTTQTLEVTEITPDGCAGNVQQLPITVQVSPPISAITGPAAVCENQAGVNYSVTNTANTTYSWTVPTGASIILGQGTSAIVVNFGATGGNVQVVPTSTGGCSGGSATRGVTINRLPVLDPGLNKTVCSDDNIAVTLQAAGTSPVAASSYNISASVSPGLIANTGPTVGNGLLATAIFNDNYTNTTGGALTVTYTVTPISAAGCAGSSVNVIVTINAEPSMASGLDVTACSDTAIGLNLNTAAGSVVATSYDILSVSVPGGVTANGSNATIPQNGVASNYVSLDEYTNVGNAPLVVQYTVQPVSVNNCVGNPLTINATINPEPVISTTLDDVICSDLPIGVTLNTNGVSVAAASYYLIDVAIPGGVTPAGTNAAFPIFNVPNSYIANDVYTNKTTLPIDVVYEVQATSAAGCFGDSEFITITIDPEPIVNPSLDATVCSDEVAGINLASMGTAVAAATYNLVAVTIPAGATPAGTNAVIPASNQVAGYINNDSYTNKTNAAIDITYEVRGVSADNCIGDSEFIILTVDPEPVISPSLDATVCSDVPIGINFATNGTSVAAASYDFLSVSIDPGLTANAGNVILANGVMAGYVAADEYTNTTNASLTVTYEVRGTAAGTGCVGDSEFIVVTIDPEPVISAGLNTTVCSDNAINVTFATNGTSIAAANYNVVSVTIPPGLTAGGGNVAFPANGVTNGYIASDTYTNQTTNPLVVTYNVQGVSGANCVGNALPIAVTINPEPVISTTLNTTVCSDNATGLVLSTLVSSVAAANYNIVAVTIPAGLTPGPNAGVPANGVVANYLSGDTYTNKTNGPLTVTYEVRGVSAAPCVGDSRFIDVIIDPEPVIDNTLAGTVCSSDPIALALGTAATSEPAANYDVTSVNIAVGLVAAGSNAVIPGNGVGVNYLLLDAYQNPTNAPLTVTYNIRGTSAKGCIGDLQPIVMTIDPEPVISPSLDKTVCSDQTIDLTLATNGVSVTADNYNVKAVTVPAGVSAAAGNAAIPGVGVAAGYLFGDSYTNVTGASVDVTYEVTAVSGACEGASEFIVITINPEPVINPALNTTVCSDAVIGVTLSTNGTSVAAANYNIVNVAVSAGLSPGGGNVGFPVNNQAANYIANDTYENTTGGPLTVTYNVTPNSAAGCVGDLVSIIVTIDPEPIVDPALDKTVCSDEIIGLNFATAGGSTPALTYNLIDVTVPAGLTAGVGNASFPSAGELSTYVVNDVYTNVTNSALVVIYEVQAVSALNCIGNSEFINVTINPEPVINTGLDVTVCSDQTINVTLSTNGISAPAASYNIKGVSIPVGVTSGANVVVPATGVAAGYIFSDSYTNKTNAPLVVTYEVTGVSGATCEGDSEFINITINPEPVISPSLSTTICSDDVVGVTLATNGTSIVAANYNIVSVVIGPGLVASGTNVAFPANGVAANYFSNDVYTNKTTGTRTVVYEVRGVSASGCLGDSEFITISIDPEPIVSATLDNTVCSDAVIGVNFATDPSATGAVNYNLVGVSISAGLTPAGSNAPFPTNGVNTAYIAGDIYTNTTGGALTVTYNVQGVSVDNCIGDTRSIIVTINPEPVINPGLDATVCSDLAIGLNFATNGTSVGAANYNLINVTVGGGLTAAAGNVVPANGINANYVANDRYTNTTNAAIVVTYEVRGVSAAGCIGNSELIDITINPEPTMNPGLDKTICSDEVSALNLSSDGLGIAATTFNIVAVTIPGSLTPNAGNAAFPSSGVAGNYLANDIFTNVSAASADVVYEVRGVSAAGCIGDSEFITVTVDPEPVISPSLNTTVCSDQPISVTFNTNGTSIGAANYDVTNITIPAGVTAGGSNVVVPANAVPAAYIAADTYTNQTSGSLVVTYSVQGNSADNCTGNVRVISVTIDPEPVVNTTLDKTVCSDASTGLVLNTNGTSIGASNYNIIGVTIDPNLTPAAGNAAFPATGVAAAYLSNDVFTNASSAPHDVVYEVRGVSFSACEGDSRFITVSIEPGPIVSPNLDKTLCSDSPIGISFSTDVGSVAATAYNVLSITANPSLIVGGGNVPPANNVASNYIFNDTYTNTTSIPLTVSYEVKGVSAASCRGPSEFIVVTIDPEPVLDPGLDKTVCSDEAVGLILNTNGVSVGANTYNVIGVTIPGGVTANASNAAIPATGVVDGYLSADKYTNVTNGPLVVTYEARGESANTCEGNSRFINITIDPEPVVASTLNATVCSDDAVGVTLATNGVSVAAATYNILTVTPAVGLTNGSNVPVPANGVAPGYFSGDTYTNKTSGPLNVVYEVQGVSVDNCIGDSRFITVTINPEPVVDPAITNSVCSDDIIAINLGTAGTSVNASTYDVLSVNIPAGLTAGGNAAIPGNGVGIGYLSNDTYTNVTATPLNVVYTVRGNSLAGCTGDTQLLSVTINPEPVLNPGLNTTVCSDEAGGILLSTNGTSVSAGSYNLISVTPQAGLVANPGNALPALGQVSTYLQNDQYTNLSNIPLTVQYVVAPVSPLSCVGDQLIIVLTVNPEPVLDPALSPTPVCSDVATGLILAVDATSVAADHYNILNITRDPALIPGGSNSAIGNNKAAAAIAGDTYTNTSNVQKIVTYDIVPVSADNCEGDVQQVVLTINPAPRLSSTLDKITCSDQNSGIILNTNGVSTPAQNYEIQSVVATGLTPAVGNVGLPVTSNNTLILNGDSYTNPTNNTLTAVYTVVPISAAGCRGPSGTVTLTVEPGITAVAANTTPTICSNSQTNITLSSLSVPSAGSIVFNLSAVASSPFVSGYIPALNFLPQGYTIADFLVNTGNTVETVTYTITPVASGGASGAGCNGTPIVEVVTIEPKPIIAVGQFDVECSGVATNYTITTQNSLAGTTFTWLAPTVSDPGLTGGTARAVASGTPIADTFTNATNVRQSATYDVTPIGPSGCVGSPTPITIFVDPTPAGTIAVDNPIVCQNSSVLLSFTMTVGVAPFEIVYGDGTTDFTVSNIANTHFIAKNGLTANTTYTLKSIQDVNGCQVNVAGQSVDVTVENPISDFTADIVEDCTPLTVTFTNNNIQAGTQYDWSWGDGSPIETTSAATVAHTFVNNSTVSDVSFNVVMTAKRVNGAVTCSQTTTQFVTIKAGVNLSINTTVTEGCSPLLVSFQNSSQGVLTNKWFWREQGTTDENEIKDSFFASYILSNTSTASKTYEIVYQGGRNGCGDEVVTEVLVHPEVIADFDVAPSNNILITNPVITVTNNTLNKAAWGHLWEWGDGETTTAVDPGSHTYATFGNFELKLTVTDPGGNCTSEHVEFITVEPVLPVVDFTADITEGCRALTIQFTSLSTSVDPNTYFWQFKNERGAVIATSNLENPEITFYDAGRINVSLSGSNPLGITDTETKLNYIEVFELPTSSFTVTPETVFLPDQLLFTSNLSSLADAFEWDFNGDGDMDSEEFEPQFKYESAGVYDISLIAINTATTCTDTFEIKKAVKVVEGGEADIPNGFFPGSGNGNGGNPGGPGGSGAPNSVFLPRVQGVREDGFLMQIFDRWGHLLFESSDKSVGWNGRDNGGKLYPVGVYVYKLELVYVSGQQTTMVGDVTLIR